MAFFVQGAAVVPAVWLRRDRVFWKAVGEGGHGGRGIGVLNDGNVKRKRTA